MNLGGRLSCAAGRAVEGLEPRRMLSAHLVKDINVLPANYVPTPPVEIGGGVGLFIHAKSAFNSELFRTDVTAGGTYLVKEIFPGQHSSDIHGIVRAGDVGYFVADDGPADANNRPDYEVWRSDGTAAGTWAVIDNDPGPRGGGALTPVGPGDRLFFLAEDAAHGAEWYVTDGRPNDARLVTDLFPGFAGVRPSAWGSAGNVLLFQSLERPGVLYASDGTEAGTVPIATGVTVESGLGNFGYSNVGFSNAGFVRSGGFAYFVDEPTGSLFRTDGTAAGTTKVVDAAMPGVRLIEAVDAGGALFFAGLRRGDDAPRMYRYDPAVGLRPVTLASGESPVPSEGYPLTLTPVGQTLYFNAAVGRDTRGLYRLAPGRTTATLVPDAPVTFKDSGVVDLAAVGPTLYFRNGAELWKVTRPDAPATRFVTLARPPAQSTITGSLAPLGDKLIFVGSDPEAGWELFRSDGTAEGTKPIGESGRMSESSGPTDFAPFGAGYLFSAVDGVHGREPFFTDGTRAGTVALGDLLPGRASSIPRDFTTVETEGGPRAFFAATDGGGSQLWVTDGTPGGTRRVAVLDPTPYTSDFQPTDITAGLGPARGTVFFVADDGVHGSEVWRSDGTAAGTFMIADIQQGRFTHPPGELTAMPDGTLLFAADDDVHGIELWKTDGTAAGTVMLKNILPDPDLPGQPNPGSQPANLQLAGGYVYFTAHDGLHGRELWRTDGTAAGTAMVADIQLGIDPSNPGTGFPGDHFVEFGGKVYFAAQRSTSGLELWRTDGTAAGTTLVKDVFPGTEGAVPRHLRVAGDRLYFTAWYREPGSVNNLRQLWSTDGTAAGTTLVVPPAVAHDVEEVSVIGDRVFFRAALPPTIAVPFSSEVFTTDGTPQGTRLVADLGGDNLTSFVGLGPVGLPDGSILVSGNDAVVGTELFRYDNPWESHVAGRHVFYNRSAFDGNSAAAGDLDDEAVAADKTALRAGSAPGAFANVTSFFRGLNGVMVDIAELPGGPDATLSAADFDFGAANPPKSVTVRRGTGVEGSDRVTLVWDDFDPTGQSPHGAVGNGWLTVTVKANARTGLPAPDVFAFGNLIGEAGDNPPVLAVNALDLASVRRAINTAAGLDSRVDFNRDGRVNALDLAIVRGRLNRGLPTRVPAPVTASISSAAGDRQRRRVAEDVLG